MIDPESQGRSRRIAIVLALLIVTAVVFGIYGILQRAEADKQHELVIELKTELERMRALAERSKEQAMNLQQEAERQHKLAEENRKYAEAALLDCRKSK